MRILHIHPSLKCGGIESIINSLANQMSKFHDVTVCSIFEPQTDDQFWSTLSNRIHKVSLGKKQKGFSFREVIRIYKFIKDGNFDVVHVHGFFQYYVMAVLLLHRNIKFIYTVHSDAVKENTRWDKRILTIKRYCFQHKLMNPVTISKASKQSFENLYHCDSALIPNGIPVESLKGSKHSFISKLRNNDQTKILINIGRIDYPKNQIVLCQCVSEIISKGIDIKLIIAGPIAKKEIYDEILKFLNDRIIYIGEIQNAREYLAECDALVMPSLWEGLPLTLLEAMSVECIPICSPVGGIPNVIEDNKTGFLSQSAEKNDFIKTIERFLNTSDSDIMQIKNKCKEEFYKSYTIESTTLNYLEVYS